MTRTRFKLADIIDADLQTRMRLFGGPETLDHVWLKEQAHGLHDHDNTDARIKWVAILRDVIAPRFPKNKTGASLFSDIDLLQATARERLIAFVVWRSNYYKSS